MRVALTSAHADELMVVQLGPAPLSISGRVVDPDGQALEGVLVWVQDPTPFGRLDYAQGVEMALIDITAEEEMRGGFNTRGVYTDEAGRFELPGLFDRPYRVQVMDSGFTLQNATIRSGWDRAASRL